METLKIAILQRWAMKKFLANLIVLVVFAGACFFIGWITFLVKPGYCAVMFSKTSGIYEKPVMPGVFTWRWERLLPTNVTLETFDLSPFKTTQVVSGTLPSSKIYDDFADVKHNFSYNFKLNLSFNFTPEAILQMYRNNKIRTNDDLYEFYENRAKLASSFVAEYLIEKKNDSLLQVSAFSEEQILKILMSHKGDFDGITFSSIELLDCTLPDYEVYLESKKAYEEYLVLLKNRLDEKAEQHADKYIEQQMVIDQLEKLGALMKKYPQFEEMFKDGDAAAIMNAIKDIKGL